MRDWNPEQYLRFQAKRTQPSVDLIHRIQLKKICSAIDIGCGPGNSMQTLFRRWPDAAIEGLDISEKMIQRAKTDYPDQKWFLGDAATYKFDRHYDLVFSNAALQWIENHESLIPRLFRLVHQSGVLAVQVPANFDSPLHQALLEISRRERWASCMGNCVRKLHYHGPEFYYSLLTPLAGKIDLWQTEYFHILDSQQALLEWYRGTGMRPYLEKLPSDEAKVAFANEVLDACKDAYPIQNDGKVMFPFKRLFFIAYAQG